jgi:glutathione S-transferase
MRTLFHIEVSTFSRRVRLALTHKGLDAELRDCRADPHNLEQAKRLSPLAMLPILVDDGRAVPDSGAIVHYLDAAYPETPRLLPLDREALAETLAIMTAVEFAMTTLVDMGSRYFALSHDAAWAEVSAERMARAHDAMDFVAKRATRPFLVGDAWSAADIWALTAVRWVGSMAARAAQGTATPHVMQILTLGFRLPEALLAWVEQHESRPDVRAIYG